MVLRRATVYHPVYSKLSRKRANPTHFHPILEKSSDLINPVCRDNPVNRFVAHSIITHGNPDKPPVCDLFPTRYKIAKDDFEQMLDLGTILCSSSIWSSVLYMVPKKSGNYCPCGDYLAVKSITVSNTYSILNVQNFSSNLQNKKIFSKTDLVRSYNQIPMAKADVLKTTIATLFGLFEFLRMPFDLRTVVQIFQRFIG
ncbi:unnamed protein product [Hymenolepis diminuta]|uniref:Reverse transcriptase domain-containing protein n=1 Tax=Hymenolepis diminuta TaxID=6216 RepID=A0A564YYC0_HYMDI|nr:unnamed protein product [Hymenolepis diminuta]